MFRTPFSFALAAFAALTMTAPPAAADDAPIQLRKGDRVVFFGDSITQGGVSPKGYVTLVKAALAEKHKDLGIEVVGAGISGNKVPDLQSRLEKDVLAKKPTVVVIYIGINDVWHGENDPARGTSVEKFEEGMKDIIARIQKAGAKVIVCTPSVIGEKTGGANELDKRLDTYSDLSRKVAKETHSRLCDLRLVFADYLKDHNDKNKEAGILTGDRVHLNDAGNKLVAESILKVLDPAK